jgi:hypothetical protein
VLIDRAPVLTEHGAATALVVPEYEVTLGSSGRGEAQGRGDARERVGLVGSDVDEL